MPRKKSVKHSAQLFRNAADDIAGFLTKVSANQSDQHVSWLHNYGIIRLYREFESLVLDALVGAINNNTATFSATTGIEFPKHLTDEVCEFLIRVLVISTSKEDRASSKPSKNSCPPAITSSRAL